MEEGELRRYMREAFRNMDREAGHISVEEIEALASGAASSPRAQEMQSHLAQCEQCRQLLQEFKQFVADSQVPTSTDLTKEWNALQHQLRPQKKIEVMRRWLPAAAAAALLLAAGISWIVIQRHASDPQRLLAQAYSQQRNSEFRLAHAPYGPVRQERGGRSTFHLPQSLLKAQDKLKEELESSPQNPDLLRLQGEAEMMERDATAAIQTLEKASDLRPQDDRILADLGVAYALHGDVTGAQPDYHHALDLLSRSLQIQPRIPEIMFNRALVLEKMKLFDQAVQEWQDYLRLEPDPNWANEARQYLANLQNKMQSREDALHRIDADPAKFLARVAAGERVDAEAYLRDYAVTEWLPRSRSNESAKAATKALAKMFKQHGDSWLEDMARANLSQETLDGIAGLKATEADINNENFRAVLGTARQATHSFLRAANLAGSLRARLSEVVALKLLLQNENCLQTAESLRQELDHYSYVQLRARVRIEQAICDMRLGDLKEAATLLRQAIQMSEAAGLNATALDADTRYLDSLGHVGLQSDVFSSAKRSLDTFWAGAYPAALFYQVVDDLRLIASRANQPYTAWFLARSAVWAAKESSNRLRQGMAHASLAVRAEEVGESSEAEFNLQLSEQLLAQSPPAYHIESQADFAEVELKRGQIDSALSRLQALRNDLPPGPFLASVRYFSVLGEASRRKGLIQDAIQAFQQSIMLGNLRHLSMASERERAGILKTIEGSYRGLVATKLAEENSDSAALEIWQSYRAQDSGVTLADIQSHDGSVLWFVELPDGLVAWLVRDRHASLHRFDVSKEVVSGVITRFLRECSDRTGNDLRLQQDARKLYQWMIEPFAAQLNAQDRSVVVDLDGIFSSVPLQALIANDGINLGDRFSITVASAFAAGGMRRELDRRSMALIVANPTVTGESATEFPPLPASVEEAGIVRAVFPRNELLKGDAASVAALVAALPDAEVVHFAGHGSTDWENGALVFAANPSTRADYDLLRSTDLQRQDWSRSALVVLSACAVAGGETRGTHNPDSLVRALSKAGASRILASSWNVDASATAELMQAFYASLATGATPDRALQAAEQEVRKRPGWKHPYYWAGFQVYGTV